MVRARTPWRPAVAAGILGLLAAHQAHAACAKTTWQPIQGDADIALHNVYALTDPSGQQTALFDLAWGGTLVSLTYNGADMIWGPDPGGAVQPAYFGDPLRVVDSGGVDFYNPEQAGGPHLFGTPVFGASCTDSNTVLIIAGATDYFGGRSGYRIANPVLFSEATNQYDVKTDQYAAPHTMTTLATFVANPSGPPSYYLKITQTILNNHPTEDLIYSIQIAGYVPARLQYFSSYPASCLSQYDYCMASQTPNIVGGLYSDPGLTDGTALYIKPQRDWPFGSSVWIEHSTACQPSIDSCLAHTVGPWALGWSVPPTTPRTMDFFVLVGSWTKALSFATQP